MIGSRSRFALVAAAALTLAIPAAARELTAAEQADLATTVAAFDAAMRANDMARVVETIPPKVLDALAAEYQVPVADLKAAVIEQMAAAVEEVTFESFGMDLGNATYEALADGTPYALIPTETVMSADGTKLAVTSETLALLDEGRWYLIRIEPSQLAILTEVYPGLADVTFTPGTMEAVEE